MEAQAGSAAEESGLAASGAELLNDAVPLSAKKPEEEEAAMEAQAGSAAEESGLAASGAELLQDAVPLSAKKPEEEEAALEAQAGRAVQESGLAASGAELLNDAVPLSAKKPEEEEAAMEAQAGSAAEESGLAASGAELLQDAVPLSAKKPEEEEQPLAAQGGRVDGVAQHPQESDPFVDATVGHVVPGSEVGVLFEGLEKDAPDSRCAEIEPEMPAGAPQNQKEASDSDVYAGPNTPKAAGTPEDKVAAPEAEMLEKASSGGQVPGTDPTDPQTGNGPAKEADADSGVLAPEGTSGIEAANDASRVSHLEKPLGFGIPYFNTFFLKEPL